MPHADVDLSVECFLHACPFFMDYIVYNYGIMYSCGLLW